MWLIVGLGNPGTKYLFTRHNVGFMAIDSYLRSIGQPPEKKQHKSITASFTIEGLKVLMAKPQTYMNNSGEAVLLLSQFYKIPSEHILVLHDEIELPFGQLKLQHQRGHGGHNGIRDIHSRLGTNNYYRLRIGVGRPDGKMDVSAHVLSSFNESEQSHLPDVFDRIGDALETLMFSGFEKAATLANRKPQTETKMAIDSQKSQALQKKD